MEAAVFDGDVSDCSIANAETHTIAATPCVAVPDADVFAWMFARVELARGAYGEAVVARPDRATGNIDVAGAVD